MRNCLLFGHSVRSKHVIHVYCLLLILGVHLLTGGHCAQRRCGPDNCVNGRCLEGECVCERGWKGDRCQYCGGRFRLTSSSGVISDGPHNYTTVTKCTWLVDSGRIGSTIRLRFNEFATECSWDHVYVYDGDSVFAPLVATFSGLLTHLQPNRTSYELTTTSGYAYLHFFSDAAYNMSGFNISYSLNSCPLDCSGHGSCDSSSVCTCQQGWKGDACNEPACPNLCSNHGHCDYSGTLDCICDPGYRGADCNLTDAQVVWERERPGLPGRASHVSVQQDVHMWIVGGYTFSSASFHNLIRYHLIENTWSPITPTSAANPASRYGHTAVLYRDKIIMFGGLVEGRAVTNETWAFDTVLHQWERLSQAGLALEGHSANMVDSKIIVIFGHNPDYGYSNKVLEYNPATDKWRSVATSGAAVSGSYGHTSVYDPVSGKIYIHGGYTVLKKNRYTVSDFTFAFDPETAQWSVLPGSGVPRYLHSAVTIGGFMLVFGGNTHNDTSTSSGAKCFSADYLAYDLECHHWQHLTGPGPDYQPHRFGHSAVVLNRTMMVFGGFNSVLLGDILKYSSGDCALIEEEDVCISAPPVHQCVWTEVGCMDRQAAAQVGETRQCPPITGSCEHYGDCGSCLTSIHGCHWCTEDNKCKTKDACTQAVSDIQSCPAGPVCNTFNCYDCQDRQGCIWQSDECKEGTSSSVFTCKLPCSHRMDIVNCTMSDCMWCSNQKRCVDSNAYVPSFPYGQCLEWCTKADTCPRECSALRTCEACQEQPQCGWCDDGSQTGLGVCMEGSSAGPMVGGSGGDFHLNTTVCPVNRWYFTSCPDCQCNGHSTCGNSSVCQQCQDLTQGTHCEQCVPGYYGDATNGGNCTACQCHGHADHCNAQNGDCYCNTKGIIGKGCDRCDVSHRYFGDPVTGTCYYDCLIDYQFTFNLSKNDDQYYTGINFMNVPNHASRDVTFTINTSAMATMNITVASASEVGRRVLVTARDFTFYKSVYSHVDYSFGSTQNTTFYVIVYNFTTPLLVQVTFSQHGGLLDLVQFFVTFFSCFLSLLLVAGIFWKVKQRVDTFRRRREMIIEMAQMASRPFSKVMLEMEINTEPRDGVHKAKRRCPGAISLEPLAGNKAAVLSVFMHMSTGDSSQPAVGHTGLAVGSTLVAVEHSSKPAEGKDKQHMSLWHRKHHSPTHIGTCI
ncbi:attractin-like protein 1 [Branchiostoma floridae x Branchiostoma belcheri]